MPNSGSIKILSDQVTQTFNNQTFDVADTGGGLAEYQIDLYYGPDDPLGPGKNLFVPASAPNFGVSNSTVSLLKFTE